MRRGSKERETGETALGGDISGLGREGGQAPKPPVLKSILLRNFLSFGPETAPLELQPLNVLIGPNGSGKSNLIEAISLLQSAPRDLTEPLQRSGGIQEWLWKGAVGTPTATIEVALECPLPSLAGPTPVALAYRLSFTEARQKLRVADERLYDEGLLWEYYHFNYEADRGVLDIMAQHRELRRKDIDTEQSILSQRHRVFRRKDIDTEASILSQRKDPDSYPELTAVGRLFESFRLYRDWNFGPSAEPRRPQSTLLADDYLDENAQNLGLVLDRLRREAGVKRALMEHLKTVYEPAEDIQVRRFEGGGYAQILLKERGYRIPASRLSDGTLRWLGLLLILLHPSPPPLVCIEEPELGLHPDMMVTLATLLCQASERMQLIVTTHSDILVDALSDTPESIVVCEKEAGATTLKRLDREQLAWWLERYSLAQLWRSGEIGGNRW